MKRLLTICFLLAGVALAHTAHAQDDGGKKKKKAKKTQSEAPAPASGSSGGEAPGDIAIDESGAPKVKGKNTPATGQNDTVPKPKKQEATQHAPAPPAGGGGGGSPEPIAIDEGGAPKVKRPANGQQANDKPKSDSVIKSPANQLGRPDEE